MLAPYRIAARPEQERPDDADAYEALLRARATRSRRVATAFCVALAALSLLALAERPPRQRVVEHAGPLSVASVHRAKGAIAAARARANAEQAAFAAVVGAALEADLAPDPRAPACEVRLPRPSRLARSEDRFPILVVEEGDRDLPSAAVARTLADVARAERHLAAGRFTDAILHADVFEGRRSPGSMAEVSPAFGHELVLVATTRTHPVRTTSTSYEPGKISGRVYLYDHRDRRVACVGEVHASSSQRIEFGYLPSATGPAALDVGPMLSASLEADLDAQLKLALANAALFQVDAGR